MARGRLADYARPPARPPFCRATASSPRPRTLVHSPLATGRRKPPTARDTVSWRAPLAACPDRGAAPARPPHVAGLRRAPGARMPPRPRMHRPPCKPATGGMPPLPAGHAGPRCHWPQGNSSRRRRPAGGAHAARPSGGRSTAKRTLASARAGNRRAHVAQPGTNDPATAPCKRPQGTSCCTFIPGRCKPHRRAPQPPHARAPPPQLDARECPHTDNRPPLSGCQLLPWQQLGCGCRRPGDDRGIPTKASGGQACRLGSHRGRGNTDASIRMWLRTRAEPEAPAQCAAALSLANCCAIALSAEPALNHAHWFSLRAGWAGRWGEGGRGAGGEPSGGTAGGRALPTGCAQGCRARSAARRRGAARESPPHAGAAPIPGCPPTHTRP